MVDQLKRLEVPYMIAPGDGRAMPASVLRVALTILPDPPERTEVG